MKGRLLKILSSVVTVSILASTAIFARDVDAATGKTYDGTIKDYTYTETLNTGRYFQPSADGKYPLMLYFHGSSKQTGLSDQGNLPERLLNDMNKWIDMGYCDPMVVVCPKITNTVYWGTVDFQGFVDNGYLDTLLKNIKNNKDNIWGKVDLSKPIVVAGYSMGGAEALYIGTKYNGTDSTKEFTIYNVGAFSPALTYYSEGSGWISKSSDVVFSQRTDGHFFMSYGDGEEKGNFDANVIRYLNTVKNNGKNLPDRFESRVYSADFGPHGWRVFELGTFDFLYYIKYGSIPSEEIRCNSCWGKVTISGTTSVGNTLTASCISYYYTKFKYQWYRVDASTDTATAISGATSQSYTLTSSDAGYKIRCKVIATDPNTTLYGYSYKTTDVISSSQQSQTAITGTVSLSSSVIRYGISVQAAAPNSNAKSFNYQWMRNGSAINGATSDWYQISKDDIGNQLSCVMSDKSGKYTGTISSSKYTVLKANGPVAPSVTGVNCSSKGAKDGKIQNVTDKMEYATVTSSGPSAYTTCTGSSITGLGAGTYYVRIKETATTDSSSIATVVIGENNSSSKAITGTVTLSYSEACYGCEVSATVSGTNASNLKYQWKRGNAVISGATSSKYTFQKDDIGTNITCVVSDKDGKLTGTISSRSTTIVQKAKAPEAPSVTAVDCSSKGAKDGKILNVSTAMEYASGSQDGTYAACTGTTIAGLSAGTYYVRLKETSTAYAGKAAKVTIGEKDSTITTVPEEPTISTAPETPETPSNDDPITPSPSTDRSETSKEQITKFVNNIYTTVLGREAEAEGAAFWFDELWNFRRSGDEVALGFICSQEFTNRNLSDEDFVKVLYKAFFDREPDESGMNYWLNSLSTGSLDRNAVAKSFVYSQEWADTCAKYGIRCGGDVKANVSITPSDSTYAFVERMYVTALGRASDADGKEYWANELSNYRYTGEQLGLAFFLSEEMNSLKLSDEEFVDRLYQTFMDREGDSEGKAFWTKKLSDGASRRSVVLGFTRSAEFTERCVNDRILPF